MPERRSMTAPFGRGRLRKLFGLDRASDPNPAATRKGEPLRPFTIPNLVGYLRLAGIPVFCVLAFGSGDGRDTTATVLFWLIAAGDYVDGFLARVTGQYSRLGALMDPVIDRLTILSGAAVCWHFELLPRWALALLAVRELATLSLAQYGLRHGLDLEINWLGRVAVFPVMSAIFFAMVFAGWVPVALLYLGLVLGCIATWLYYRMGREARAHAEAEMQARVHSP
jgi:cardiolipin synthase